MARRRLGRTTCASSEQAIGKDVVLLADDVGLAVATKTGERVGFLDILYVRPKARGKGIAHELVREAAAQLRAQGAEMLELEVLASNGDARAVYERWGFAPVELTLAAPVDALVERLDRSDGPTVRLDPRPDRRRRCSRARRAQGAAAHGAFRAARSSAARTTAG